MSVNPLNFIDQAFDVSHLQQDNKKYKCPICLSHKKVIRSFLGEQRDFFIVHEGEGGAKHPIHRSCIQESLNKSSSKCPSCNVSIKNNLVSPSALGTRFFESGKAATAGAKTVSNIYIFGAFAATTCAAWILFGQWATRDTLAVSGGGYAMAYVAGFFARFFGNGAVEQSRIDVMAPVSAMTGFLGSFYLVWTRATQQAYLFQGIAVYGFSKSAGFVRTGVSAGLGLATAAATRYLFQPNVWEKTLTTLTGSLGTLINGIDSKPWITIVPALAGMSASYCTYEEYGPICSAMIGTVTSGIASSIFRQAYGDKQHAG